MSIPKTAVDELDFVVPLLSVSRTSSTQQEDIKNVKNKDLYDAAALAAGGAIAAAELALQG